LENEIPHEEECVTYRYNKMKKVYISI